MLIPKITSSESFFNLCFISLYGVVNKIITKLIPHKLKLIMSQIISPTQTNFVPGLKIVDNTLAILEVVHSMKLKKD